MQSVVILGIANNRQQPIFLSLEPMLLHLLLSPTQSPTSRPDLLLSFVSALAFLLVDPLVPSMHCLSLVASYNVLSTIYAASDSCCILFCTTPATFYNAPVSCCILLRAIYSQSLSIYAAPDSCCIRFCAI
jgi:hypothetical protein